MASLLSKSVTTAVSLVIASSSVTALSHTHHGHRAHPAHSMSGSIKMGATLSGASEIPVGAPDAAGKFSASINAAHTQLCYDLTVTGLSAPTAAHIHIGAMGQNGAPVVMLATPSGGKAKACMMIASSLGQKLAETPQGYYVNVHNAQFPGGGLRGQLAK
jgi:hypothetical protein